MKPTDPLSIDAYHVERTLPHLLNRAGVAVADAFLSVIRPLGLTIPDWRILTSLLRQDGMTLSALAERASLELSTVSRRVGAGVRKGWMRRVGSPRDGRAVQVLLTARGRRIVEGAIPTAQLYEHVALAGVTPEQAEALKSALARIYSNIASLLPRANRKRLRQLAASGKRRNGG